MAEIGEHARADADGGRGKRRAEKEAHHLRQTEERSERESAGEGDGHARHRHDHRRDTALNEAIEIGLQTDDEEEKDDAELRQKVNGRVVRIDQVQSGDADDRAADQLTENGGLAEALRDLAEQLRRCEDRDEREEKLGDAQNSSSIGLYTPSLANGTYSKPRPSGSSLRTVV
jgi:hypothetical protein